MAHRHIEDEGLTGTTILDQWIERPGFRFMAYGRLIARKSYGPTLTRDQTRAHRFASRKAAQAQIDRYYRWIAKQFTVEPSPSA